MTRRLYSDDTPGSFFKFAKAADTLSTISDPLGINTLAFDKAHKLAWEIFNKSSPIRHDVKAWQKQPCNTQLDMLTTLVSGLKKICDPNTAMSDDLSKDVVKDICNEIELCIRDNELIKAIRHAKALDHHSVTAGFINRNRDQMLTVRNNRFAVDEVSERHLRQALVRLWPLRNEGLLSLQHVSGDCHELIIDYKFTTEPLLNIALGILDDKWGDHERNRAQTLAGIIRGLNGAPTTLSDAQKIATSSGNTVKISLNAIPED